MSIQNCLESSILTSARHLKDNGYDEFTLRILVTNLSIIRDNRLELANCIKDELMEVVIRTCNISEEELTEEDFSHLVSMMSLILDYSDCNRICDIESVLMNIATETEMVLTSPLPDILANSSALIRKMRLMEVLLNSVTENKVDSNLYATFPTLKEIIIRVFLSGERSLITYALVLLSVYHKLTRCSSFLQQIWSRISLKVSMDSMYFEPFLIILTHLLFSDADLEVKLKIINTSEFWSLLKKCFEDFGSIRKYAFRILKYAVSHIGSNSFKPKHGVWDYNRTSEYNCWWKTYFIIIENLDEKQSHLVLPVFRMIHGLVNCNVQIDMFWILNAIQYAMMHDSRTVRIQTFLCLFSMKTELFDNNYLPSLTKILLQNINDSVLFRKIFKTENFDKFKSQFCYWLTEFSSRGNGGYFVELMFCNIVGLKWSPIPLFYVLEFMTESISVQSKLSYDVNIKNFILSLTRFHSVPVRAAIQCLFIKLLCRTYECTLETVTLFLHVLNCFNEKESLERGMLSWNDVVEYLKKSMELKSAEMLILTRLENDVDCSERSSNNILYTLARDLLLMHDAFDLLEKSDLIREYFLKIIYSFSSARQKPYLDTKVQDNYLKLLAHMSSIIKQSEKTSCSGPVTIINMMRRHSTDMLAYTVDRMLKSSENFMLLDLYAFCLDKFSDSILLMNVKSLEALLNDQSSRLSGSLSNRCSPSVYSSFLVMLWIYNTVISHPTTQAKNVKSITVATFVNFVRTNAGRSFILECDLKNEMKDVHGTVQSNFANVFWKFFTIFSKLEYQKLNVYFETTMILDLVLEFLDLARRENLGEIFRTLRYILRNEVLLNNEEIVIRIMDGSWKRLKEIQANTCYFKLLNYWIRAFFQKTVLKSPLYYSKLCDYVTILLKAAVEDGGQSYQNIVLVLQQLDEIEKFFCTLPEISNILVNAFCIAHISRKDQRVEYETVAFISSWKDANFINRISEFNFRYSSEEMRLRALNLLLKSVEDPENSLKFFHNIIELLTSTDDSSKKRYFNDSLFHRTKTRKLQLLLIFETILHEKSSQSKLPAATVYKKIYSFVVHSLLVEPHQPSVRYLLEWLLIRVVIHRPTDFEEEFWHSFSGASEERIGSICSFISVVYHLANAFNSKTFIDKSIQSTLPWTMAQHFNARLYAQTVLVKLINLGNETKHEYEMLEKSLISCLKRGNAVKNSIKLQEDFYFAHFNPLTHFSLQVILWDLPRLSHISHEEWIPVSLYEQFVTTEVKCIPLFDESNSFSQFSHSSWIAKAAAASHFDDKNGSFVNDGYNASQKKFIPMKYDMPGLVTDRNPRKQSHLIVVASLIDKAPNLGGLTRTSEVFGVSTLVFDNLDIVRNKEFISLSITSEKHVSLLEVKQYNLFNYLKCKKEDQYYIVGAEQVTNSVLLSDFSFPLKTVIVLGNEKEGIPADLLPVIDVCVEIPQLGVIRSLNVHVSASLLIWEYTKQHLFS